MEGAGMHRGEAPGREVHPGPQREYASPVRLRDDGRGDREVAQKGKNVKYGMVKTKVVLVEASFLEF